MNANPQRAHFSRLFTHGNFASGMEVGVADGRFSQHFLQEFKLCNNGLLQQSNVCSKSTTRTFTWTMVEPFPNEELLKRYNPSNNIPSSSSKTTATITPSGTWNEKGLLENITHTFHEKLSLDVQGLLDHIPNESYDFIYLDGDHSYEGVKQELPLFWNKVTSGGILAGHDYCNYGEASLPCKGCNDIPKCLPCTEYGKLYGKDGTAPALANQHGVVKAVQEWLHSVVEMGNDELELFHTMEDFSRESLLLDGMDYDLVITNTRNPSWFIVKP